LGLLEVLWHGHGQQRIMFAENIELHGDYVIMHKQEQKMEYVGAMLALFTTFTCAEKDSFKQQRNLFQLFILSC